MVDRKTRKKQASVLLKIAKAIGEAGAPAHRLETLMQVVMDKFGMQGSFFSMPTAILASLGDEEYQRSYMVRITPGDIDLSTLQEINAIINQLESDRISIDDALKDIKQIVESGEDYPNALMLLAFAVVSAGFTALFQGSWIDVGCSAAMGLLTGVITVYSQRNSNLALLYGPMSAFCIGFLSIAINHWQPLIDHFLVSLAGLIILVPGLGITVAMRELSTGHLVSGSSRMAGAVTTLFLLVFGLAFGYLLAQYFFGEVAPVKGPPIPMWFSYLMLLAMAASFAVLFKSRVLDMFWILFSITLAYLSSEVVGHWIQQPYKSLITVMLISVAGNLYARISQNPAAIIHIPGVILLVPGSIGFNSLSAMLNHDTLTGVQAAFDAMLIAVSISIGLLMGNLFISTQKNL